MQSPASFTAEEGKIVVRFRDIPAAITQGDGELDAMQMAEDVLLSSMDFYFEDSRMNAFNRFGVSFRVRPAAAVAAQA